MDYEVDGSTGGFSICDYSPHGTNNACWITFEQPSREDLAQELERAARFLRESDAEYLTLEAHE